MNIVTAITHKHRMFLHTIKALVNYVEAFWLQCGVGVADAITKVLVNNTVSLYYPPWRKCGTHNRDVRFAKLLVKSWELLPQTDVRSSDDV